jgi:hypothetical protein
LDDRWLLERRLIGLIDHGANVSVELVEGLQFFSSLLWLLPS